MSNQQRQRPRNTRRRYSQQEREARWKYCTEAWLGNIDRATAVIHSQHRHQPNGFAGFNNYEEHDREEEDPSNTAMQYLDIMETRLHSLEQHWDHPPLSLPPESRKFGKKTKPKASNTASMEMRRILIRVVNAQSELFAYQASQCRWTKPRPLWSQGAELYGLSLDRIHCALDLADSQCVKEIADSDGWTPPQQEDGAYQTDASIVEVAIGYLAGERAKYHKAALKQLDRLQEKLQPQWQSRDEVKAKLGDRWFENPSPKNDFSNRRREDEAEIKDLQDALVLLSSQSEHKVSKKKQRYNGMRPSVRAKRVIGYADPAHFGWRFTGSWNNYVEFWERDDCRMDWYFSRGTVKTALHHPTQGKTQLFGSKVTPEVFQQILEDPRVHTNVRYQRKANKPATATD